MLIPPRPEREAERLARLRDFGVLDTLPEQAFEDITALAASICGTPMALISLIDEKRQWFKSVRGMDTRETDRDMAFCAHAILRPYEVMEVPDAREDWRFKDNPLVMDAPRIRFYAGMPITTPDGLALGTVCVADHEARQLTGPHRSALQSLASLVLHLLERDRQHKEHARREAAEAERRLEYLSAASLTGRDLMAFVDPGHVYRFANATYLEYWGRTKDSLLGCPVAEVMGTPLYAALARGGLDQALAGQQTSYESTIDFLARAGAMSRRPMCPREMTRARSSAWSFAPTTSTPSSCAKSSCAPVSRCWSTRHWNSNGSSTSFPTIFASPSTPSATSAGC